MRSKLVPIFFIVFFSAVSMHSQYHNNGENESSTKTSTNPHQSILKNTERSDHHKTLLAVMRAADLEEVLGFNGPFTVFAPSDQAFQKLAPEKIIELLLPENKKELHALMTYHIVAGNFSASKILKAMCRGGGAATFTTVQGAEITATMQGVDIILTDNTGNQARITLADSNQSNGVIHEIDSVIRPGKI